MRKNLLFLPLIIVIVIVLGYAYRIAKTVETEQTVLQIQSERANLLLITPAE